MLQEPHANPSVSSLLLGQSNNRILLMAK